MNPTAADVRRRSEPTLVEQTSKQSRLNSRHCAVLRRQKRREAGHKGVVEPMLRKAEQGQERTLVRTYDMRGGWVDFEWSRQAALDGIHDHRKMR